MKIVSIKLQNFLCYYGNDNLFEFTDGLNIVLGANGYGKSKLYDAFQWIFHDLNNNQITRTLKSGLVSEKAKHEAGVGDKVTASVILEVNDKSGRETYQLVRSYNITKREDSGWNEPENSKFEIFKKNVLDYKPQPEHEFQGILEMLIPTDVRPYLWFQGERGVSDLIDTSNYESLTRLVKRLSYIDIWQKIY